ncbi:MAG: hypothetical protein AAB675_04065 [Patescibacteria group bacterium]|mgnify:CR=1 FL=1
MVKKFEYIRAGLWYRPIIPVTLRYGKQEVSYLALIDSGADFNIFHSDIASIFNIDLSKLKKVPFSGINKSTNKQAEGSFVELDLEVGGMNSKCMVLFSSDISPDGYGILGQQGFFNNFYVAFNLKDKIIEVKPNNAIIS